MPTTRDPPMYPPTHPPFPIKQGRFPTPGLITPDPLCLPPNAEPLAFMLSVMRDDTQPILAKDRGGEGSRTLPPYQDRCPVLEDSVQSSIRPDQGYSGH
jgi:hypothetical protein